MDHFTSWQGVFFWGFLVAFGALMYAISPRVRTESGFFLGHDEAGRPANRWALMMSIFISWIFAKSVTNAANLGAAYGIVGGLAYATYWLSIPFAGWIIFRLRTRDGATGIVPWLISRYGRAAALAFSAAILVRLFNEVWSNTAVVGGYYGDAGSPAFIGAALLFTAVVLFYSLKGGLRSSISTTGSRLSSSWCSSPWCSPGSCPPTARSGSSAKASWPSPPASTCSWWPCCRCSPTPSTTRS